MKETIKQKLVRNIALLTSRRDTRFDKETWNEIIKEAQERYQMGERLADSKQESDAKLVARLAALQLQITDTEGATVSLQYQNPDIPTKDIITVATNTPDIYEFLNKHPEYKQNEIKIEVHEPMSFI